MIVHFKETGHKIDDSKQVLVIYSPPDKVYYSNSEGVTITGLVTLKFGS